MSRPHTCHAKDCRVRVPRKRLMCRRHWFMVPLALRLDVLAAYRPGQETPGWRPSPDYLQAAREAVDAVAGSKAKTTQQGSLL
ncbi:MAG TPA: hypothetical protein VGC20_15485 [bacterium]|jgi:hypothetical protein